MKRTACTQPISEVKNGTIPIPLGMNLVEGTPVALIPLAALESDPAFLKAILKMSKPRKWSADFALKPKHSVTRKGHAKK
jgi:hypothetical protein